MSTILIVEDEPRLADILEQYLRREGFHTERAADGRRGLGNRGVKLSNRQTV